MELLDRLYPVVPVVAAGYLVAARRRSRRAAVLGLVGIALVSIWVVLFLFDTDHDRALVAAGWSDARTRRIAAIWLPRIEVAWGYGLLIWAVLVDRRPPADPESE